jgi:hypothetical protein
MKALYFCGVAVCASLLGTARGTTLDLQGFEKTAASQLPPAWTATAPEGTSVAVSGNESAAGARSLRFEKLTGSGGVYPSAVLTFASQTGGTVRVSYRARTTTSNHDALYVKLRGERGQELGGVRFGPNGMVQYQLADGAWRDSAVPYQAHTWHRIALAYDLNRGVYSATTDGAEVVAETPTRVRSRSAASLLIQDRVVAGSGQSYVDEIHVEAER